MASAALTSMALPQQQQPVAGEVVEANSGEAAAPKSASSGSIGPFFAVISVLTILAIVSCYMGRICGRRATGTRTVSPLETIKDGGLLGRLMRRCRQCMGGEVEAGAKVMSFGEDHKNGGESDSKNGENEDPAMQA